MDSQTVIIYEKGIPISGITKIIKFEELGYIRLIFKTGYHKLYPKSELDIQNSNLSPSDFRSTPGRLCENANCIV